MANGQWLKLQITARRETYIQAGNGHILELLRGVIIQ